MKAVYIILPLGAYLYGSIPFGFLAAKLVRGVDIRETGSGNIGATNAARALGWKFFPLVFLLDFSKGCLPALAGMLLVRQGGEFYPHPLAAGSAVAGILGHVFPLYLRFKGGKAVAAGTGAVLVVAPKALAVAVVVWLVVFALWRYVSLASISSAAALGVCVWIPRLCPDPLGAGVFRSVLGSLGAVLVIARHHGNIRRLLVGTEHKIGTSLAAKD